MNIRLEQAQAIVAGVLEYAASMRMKPICAIVLDARGELKAAATMDEASLKRSSIARGKADGALAMGMGSRSLFKRAKEQPFFISAATQAVGGSLVPVPGGVLIKDAAGKVLGSVGVSGCTSDNDEAAALAGIASAGLVGDPGQD